MKKVLLATVSAIVSVSAAYAQPTLTSATCSPVVGDVYVGHNLDTTGVSHGAAGASVTWNFASATATGTDTTSFLACSATPYCDSFPGSTIVMYDNIDYIYCTSSTAKFAAIGAHSDTSFIHFTNERLIMKYPLTYTNTYKDTTSLVMNMMGTDVNLDIHDSVVADGWGTLVTPAGTYSNVLRVHTFSTQIISMGSISLGESQTETYNWYKPGYHSPLMMMSYDTAGTGTPTLVDAKYFTGPSYTTGVSNVQANGLAVSVYPNPAIDAVTVKFDAGNAENVSVTVTDLTGRTVATVDASTIVKGINTVTCQLGNVAPGLYIVRVSTDAGVTTQKISVTK